jgi:hypothetical protein
LVVVAWLAFAAVSVVSSLSDIRSGRRLLADVFGKDRISEAFEPAVGADLRQAQRRLARAHERLDNPLLAPLKIVPVAGRQLRSLTSLSGAGAALAGAGADGVEEAERLVARPVATPPERITLIREVGTLAATTRRRLEQISLGPNRGLVAPLARGHDALARELDELETGLGRAARGAEALAGWLTGPRRYLVFAANNAEMRAGSGMFLSVGVLETADGRLTLGDFRTVFDLPVPPGAVPLEGDFADRWGWLHPQQDWRNLMASPRFDESAALASRMWTALGQPPVDGVIAIDPVGLEQLLRAVGPVAGPERTIDAGNVVDELLHGQYLRLPAVEQRPERREQLGVIARAVFGALDAGSWTVPDLADAVAASIKARHLMIWSAQPAEQEAWRDAGADGTLRPDSLLVSVLNRGGNKLDRYLNVTGDVMCVASGSDRDCTLRLGLANVAPAGEPPYIAGPHPGSGVNEGDYLGIVAVNLPGAARDGRIEGVEQLAVAGADGPTRVVGAQVVVPRGERRDLTVRFRLPGREGTLRVEPSSRVPGIAWSSGDRKWKDGAAFRLSW